MHEVLDELGYTGWPKTSGNRGVHVDCRIEPKWEFPDVRRCALAFAREIERRAPELVTTAWWKEERGENGLRRLQPERPRPDDRLGVLGARAAGRDGVGAGPLGRAARDVETEDFTLATMPARFASSATVQAGIDDAVCDLRALLEWVEREETEGVGEAPYPPNFPKMPGEPPRVQPSRPGRPLGQRPQPCGYGSG